MTLAVGDAAAVRSIDGPTLTVSLAITCLIATGLSTTGLIAAPGVAAPVRCFARRGGTILGTAGRSLVPAVAADIPVVASRIDTRIRTWAPLAVGVTVTVALPLVPLGPLPLTTLSRVPVTTALVRAGARVLAVALRIFTARLGPPTAVALPLWLAVALRSATLRITTIGATASSGTAGTAVVPILVFVFVPVALLAALLAVPRVPAAGRAALAAGIRLGGASCWIVARFAG
jgi:hypothetical protein